MKDNALNDTPERKTYHVKVIRTHTIWEKFERTYEIEAEDEEVARDAYEEGQIIDETEIADDTYYGGDEILEVVEVKKGIAETT